MKISQIAWIQISEVVPIVIILSLLSTFKYIKYCINLNNIFPYLLVNVLKLYYRLLFSIFHVILTTKYMFFNHFLETIALDKVLFYTSFTPEINV